MKCLCRKINGDFYVALPISAEKANLTGAENPVNPVKFNLLKSNPFKIKKVCVIQCASMAKINQYMSVAMQAKRRLS